MAGFFGLAALGFVEEVAVVTMGGVDSATPGLGEGAVNRRKDGEGGQKLQSMRREAAGDSSSRDRGPFSSRLDLICLKSAQFLAGHFSKGRETVADCVPDHRFVYCVVLVAKDISSRRQ
jgi:hypothetical protein